MATKVKKVKEDIKITEELLDQMRPLRGRIFKEFMKMGQDNSPEDDGSEAIFGVFVKESLVDIGIEIEDPYEDLDLTQFTEVLAKVMELNNMDELFRTIERLTRYTTPSPEWWDDEWKRNRVDEEN